MKKILQLLILGTLVSAKATIAQVEMHPEHIDAYITPFYNSKGPEINIGRFSKSLASKKDAEFVATIGKMRESWDRLNFVELYVAAIRLYESGYRKDAVYWYYTAQYRGRLFGMLLDQEKKGGIGDSGFELLQANNAFFQLTGPYFTGYAFTDFDFLIGTIEKVQKEGKSLPDMKAVYPGVAFVDKSQWESKNSELNDGMGKLPGIFKDKKDEIQKQRIAQGLEAKFSKLKNKDLPAEKSGK